MKRFVILAIVLVFGLVPVFPQSSGDSRNVTRELVEKLWRKATNGDLLTPDGWHEASGFFVHPGPFAQNQLVRVTSNYWEVMDAAIKGDRAKVIVKSTDAGRIDSALRYIPPEATSSVEFLYHLVLAPTHWHTYKSDGKGMVPDEERTGPPAWQIEDTPVASWTTVNTTIRYVLQMRAKTNDPAIVKNADETLAKLTAIKDSVQMPTGAGKSPEEVVKQLWSFATQGQLLTAEGWKQASGLFTHPDTTYDTETIWVASNDWAPGYGAITGDTAEVNMGYADAGKIDSSLRYIPPKSSRFFKVEMSYRLVLAPMHQTAYKKDGTTAAREITGPPVWQIDGSQGAPRGMRWTTVNTAIRYVLEMRAKTTDSIIKKNADNTIAALMHYR
jgi:hypothetical protein